MKITTTFAIFTLVLALAMPPAAAAKSKLSAFGPIDDEGDQLTFTSLKPDRVPELVSTLVALGGRIYEVAPRHQTLEDRFLQLLEEEEAN